VFTKKLYDFLFPIFLTYAFLGAAASFCFASPTADELLRREGFVWKSAATEHLRLHFEPGGLAETRIEELKIRQEKAYARNLQLLKTGGFSFQTDVFIVASRERMKKLIGHEINGVAYSDTKVVCFVFSEKINASGSHEIMHVMAAAAWGARPQTWLNEGLAVYADDRWHGYELHDLNKYLRQEKKLIPLKKLIGNFRGHPNLVSYPQAGSFVKYLYEQYGVEKIRELWKKGAVKDFKRVLGKDLAALETEWHDKLTEANAARVKYNSEASK
jgi:hypothetical protein